MAKVSAHGATLGTLEFITTAKRYMSDGTVLKHAGFGWKLYGRVKPHVTPQAAYEAAQARLKTKLEALPQLAAYRKELHSIAGLGKRWKLHTAITMMPDDADGVWSEACDGYGDNVHADLDDIVSLCALYRAIPRDAQAEG